MIETEGFIKDPKWDISNCDEYMDEDDVNMIMNEWRDDEWNNFASFAPLPEDFESGDDDQLEEEEIESDGSSFVDFIHISDNDAIDFESHSSSREDDDDENDDDDFFDEVDDDFNFLEATGSSNEEDEDEIEF